MKFASFLRNHAEALIGATAGLLIVAVLAISPGCTKTASITGSGQQVSPQQLSQEIIDAQAKLKTQQDADQIQAEALQAKVTNAQQDIANKQAAISNVVNTLGGAAVAVLKGQTDPASLIGAGLSLVGILSGVGGIAGSVVKQGIIANLRASPSPGPSASNA